MKNAEIRALSIEDLKEQINKEQSNAQTLRFAHAISPLENPTRIKQGRRNIARLLTELKRRENEQNS
ncbi:50S ribosomal protein L29 [Hymenobacter oligotrophus]|uniref:Large ribosomal subunit protein uL29 n=1 Tax=Hymenobacter oligotrophus TaxID=2319843 RepID=A0A3B7RBX8_9BACT|nr:50S ribosomal protein L29 [Hymenobacter oligotrophus]AYA38451.1 50S ribosomal protein L29 [Hymenobacter oligotrophus]